MVKVVEGTPLCRLFCCVCHQPATAGESVLVTYRDGEPRVMHAHVCFPPKRADAGEQIIRSG